MPYDVKLAARVSAVLANTPHLTEKKMFGGVGYLVSGNMACGVHKRIPDRARWSGSLPGCLRSVFYKSLRHHWAGNDGLGDGCSGGL